MKKGIISKLLTALLVVGLLFSILPSQQAQAQDVITVCPDESCQYQTIQAAFTAAPAGSTIQIGAGDYTPGTIAVNKAVSFIGAEGHVAKMVGSFNVSVSGVIIEGLDISNPAMPYAVAVNPGVDGINILFNRIHDVGANYTSSHTKVINVNNGADNVLIQGNQFKDLVHTSKNVDAIYFGSTGADNGSTGIKILDNSFENIRSTSGKGIYAINLSNKMGVTALVEGNTFVMDTIKSTGLSGFARAIGLEQTTPDTIIRNNHFKVTSGQSVWDRTVGINFEANPAAATVIVEFNNFDLAEYPLISAGTNAVKAKANWWGKPEGMDARLFQYGANSALIHQPWCTNAECTALTGGPYVLNVTQSKLYEEIQPAIDEADVDDIIEVSAGTYDAFSVVGKENLTITGAGDSLTFIEPTTLITTGVGHKSTANMKATVFVNDSTGIKIEGMAIKSTSATPGSGGADAIVFWNNSTGSIEESVIEGIYTISGAQTGQGIAVDGGTSVLNVVNTDIFGFQKNAIDVVDGNGVDNTAPGDLTVNVSGGVITGAGDITSIAQNGISYWKKGGGKVAGVVTGVTLKNLNYTPTNNSATGILFYDGGPFSESGNSFENVERQVSYPPVKNTTSGVYSRTIQSAIDAADSGDTINVAAGNYVEALKINKNITLLGPNADISPNTETRLPEATIRATSDSPTGYPGLGMIDLQGHDLIVKIKGFDFNLEDTSNQHYRYINVVNDNRSTLYVENNIFRNAPSNSNGYWWFTDAAGPHTVTILDNHFSNAAVSNGIMFGGNSFIVDIRDNVWEDNQGWAMNFNNATGTISGNKFIDRVENGLAWYEDQCGILVSGSGNHLSVTGNTFDGLTSDAIGLAYSFASWVDISGNTFIGTREMVDAYLYVASLSDLTNVSIKKNSFLLDIFDEFYPGSTPVNLAVNWWGDPAGPDPDSFIGPVSYIPWCTNEECTTFGAPPVHNTTKDTYYTTIQAAITAATAGDEITVAAGTYTEDLVINKGLTLTGAGKGETIVQGVSGGAGDVVISASNVTIKDFTLKAFGQKFIIINQSTDSFKLIDNEIITGANTTLANGWVGIETYNGTLQTNHVITGNSIVANGTAQLVYYNPNSQANMIFANNTITGTLMPGGVGVVFEKLSGTFDISSNSFADTLIGAYGFMGTPGLTKTQMDALFAANTWPANAAVVGTDIRIPDTKLLMDPAIIETTGACAASYEVTVKVQAIANMASYQLYLSYDPDLITITKVENVSSIAGVPLPDNSYANGEIKFGWYTPDGGGNPPVLNGEHSLIKITFQPKLAGTGAFTILPATLLNDWPDADSIPFEITGGVNLSFGSVVTNTSMTPNKSYCDLGVAISEAGDNHTLRMDADYTTADAYTIAKKLTLDVQAFDITTSSQAAFTVNAGGDFTLTGSGTIKSTDASGRVLVVNGSDPVTAAKATLNGPILKAPYFSIEILGNQNGDYSEAKVSHKAEMTITSGETWETVSVKGKGAKLTIDGGTLTGYAPLMGNGNSYNWGTEITMNDGSINSLLYTHADQDDNKIAIYHPQVGTLTINGGEIRGSEGIEMKAGELKITGGTIIADGPYQEPDASSNGSSWGGDAILLYSRSGYGGGNPITATITGGTFSSQNSYALREYYIEGTDTSRLDKVTISGGSFTGAADKEAVIFSTADPTKDKLALTGGDYSKDPIEFVYDPYGTSLHADSRWYISGLPVLTSDDFDDPVTLGLASEFTLTVNPSVPGTFNMVFEGYPSETEITYGSTTYTCVGDPCVITVPVTLTGAGPEDLDFSVVVATSGSDDPAPSYDVTATLHAPAPDYGTTGRDLAHLDATVDVASGFDVTGVFTMQGRTTTMAGIPVTLTWNNLFNVVYGPTMVTTENAVNFNMAVNYGGSYTLTTLQPRFLNVYAGLGKTFDVSGPRLLNSLWLRAGNAYWRIFDEDTGQYTDQYDNTIDGSDASVVGNMYGNSGSTDLTINHGDVNFDNIVNIKDLTLVGGNMQLTSADVYGTGANVWIP